MMAVLFAHASCERVARERAARIFHRSHRYAVSHKQPMMAVLFTHAQCERVARERAGGERGLLFAGQKANRVHPSIAAASEVVAATLRQQLNAGRANVKDRLQTNLLSLRKRQKGSGEKRRAFPRWAQSAQGAGRGLASQAVKPCIK